MQFLLLDDTNFFVSHTSFFSEVLLGFLVLVTWGQCLKAGTVMSKNTEWGTGVPGVRVNIKLRSYINLFKKKRRFLHRLFCVTLSDIKLLFFLSLGRASTGILYLSKRKKCSSKWEDLEEYWISTSRGLLKQIIHLFIKSASYDLADLGEEDGINGLFHGYFIQLLGTACASFSLLCTGTGEGCLVYPAEIFRG